MDLETAAEACSSITRSPWMLSSLCWNRRTTAATTPLPVSAENSIASTVDRHCSDCSVRRATRQQNYRSGPSTTVLSSGRTRTTARDGVARGSLATLDLDLGRSGPGARTLVGEIPPVPVLHLRRKDTDRYSCLDSWPKDNLSPKCEMMTDYYTYRILGFVISDVQSLTPSGRKIEAHAL